jgi:hypothetical protein
MDRLTIRDVVTVKSLLINAKYNTQSIRHIDDFFQGIKDSSLSSSRQLTENEIIQLSSDQTVKSMMILLFLVGNVALEFLRKKRSHTIQIVSIADLWSDIEELVIKKLLLSRDICAYFKENVGINSEEFNNYVKAVQNLKIEDITSELFVSNKRDHISYRLLVNGVYESLREEARGLDNELFTLYDRKTCFHPKLYDPFRFEEQQTWLACQYVNKSSQKKSIDSVFTVIFSYPELTVLNMDGTFLKIPSDKIQVFMENQIQNNGIDMDLYNSVKKDYFKLFMPELNNTTLKSLYQKIHALINQGMQKSAADKKPLLILLSEVHGSKESFLFHTIILVIAKKLGFRHLLAETINIYHQQHGWDAKADEIIRLLSFAKEDLGFDVKDLEAELHYKNLLSPYPYHEIPETIFGIETREASWIIDAKAIKKNAIMIVGCGHMNSMLNCELKNTYHILPIDCSGDKKFSDMLDISQHHFISLENSVSRFTLDELIIKVKECSI